MVKLNDKQLSANQCTSVSDLASIVETLLRTLGDPGPGGDLEPVFFDPEGGPAGAGELITPGTPGSGATPTALPLAKTGALDPDDPNFPLEAGPGITFGGSGVNHIIVGVDRAQLLDLGCGLKLVNGSELQVDAEALASGMYLKATGGEDNEDGTESDPCGLDVIVKKTRVVEDITGISLTVVDDVKLKVTIDYLTTELTVLDHGNIEDESEPGVLTGTACA